MIADVRLLEPAKQRTDNVKDVRVSRCFTPFSQPFASQPATERVDVDGLPCDDLLI